MEEKQQRKPIGIGLKEWKWFKRRRESPPQQHTSSRCAEWPEEEEEGKWQWRRGWMKDGGNVWRERRGRKDSRIKTDKRGDEAGQQQAVPLPPFVQRISFIHFTMHSKQMGEKAINLQGGKGLAKHFNGFNQL
jgi:hypothetical protein